MSRESALRELILATVRTEITDELTPYRAIVTGISDGKVQFRPVTAATGSTQAYARIRGFTIDTGDEVWVIGRRNPMVIGQVQRSGADDPLIDAFMADIKATSFVTRTASGVLNNEFALSAMTPLQSPPGFMAVSGADVTTLGSNETAARYLGQTLRDLTSVTLAMHVATAAATITWAEVGIATSAAPVIGNTGLLNLTRAGSVSVAATVASTGAKTVTVPISVPAGTHLWALYGSQATTPYQLRAGLGDAVSAGFLRFASGIRPSTMAANTSFSFTGTAARAAWIAYQWT